MIEVVYTNTESCVRVDGNTSDSFQVRSGMRQGCVLAPDSLNVVMDWILERSTSIAMHGASVADENFSDLDYTDDVALLTELMELLQSALKVFAAKAAPIGQAVNWKKTKIQSLSDFLPPIGDLNIGGIHVEAVTSFTYLGPQPTGHVGVGRRSAGDWVLPNPLSDTWIICGGRVWHFTPKSDFTMSALCPSLSMLLKLGL